MKIKVINLLINLANGTFNSNVEIKIDEKRTYTLDYYLYVMCGEMQGTYKELNNFLNQDVEVVNLSEHIKTILEEEKKIPLKINKIIPSQNYVISDSKNNSVDERLEIIRKRLYANELYMLDIANALNEIIDYLKSKGE